MNLWQDFLEQSWDLIDKLIVWKKKLMKLTQKEDCKALMQALKKSLMWLKNLNGRFLNYTRADQKRATEG